MRSSTRALSYIAAWGEVFQYAASIVSIAAGALLRAIETIHARYWKFLRHSHLSIIVHANTLNLQRNLFGARPSSELRAVKIFEADFRGEFARFEFNDVSETIGNDRSISHFIGHAAHFRANVKNTV